MDQQDDPRVRELREQISALDRSIVTAVNRRLELVLTLKGYKESRGYSFVDPERERRLVEELRRDNPGPLSDAGLEELVRRLLDLVKREVAQLEQRGR
jgi:chorismate mutase